MNTVVALLIICLSVVAVIICPIWLVWVVVKSSKEAKIATEKALKEHKRKMVEDADYRQQITARDELQWKREREVEKQQERENDFFGNTILLAGMFIGGVVVFAVVKWAFGYVF
jgi:hypothetical protein